MKLARTIIFDYLSQWCQNGSIKREDFKSISIELEQLLKKKKNIVNPLFTPCKNLFEKYAARYEAEVSWGARQGKALNELLPELTRIVRDKNSQATEDEIIDSWAMILQNLPDFYRSSYDIITISNKLANIINQIKSERTRKGIVHSESVQSHLKNLRAGSDQY